MFNLEPIEKVQQQIFPGNGDFFFFIAMAYFAKYLGKPTKDGTNAAANDSGDNQQMIGDDDFLTVSNQSKLDDD